MKPRILVIGATGTIGREVVAQLVDSRVDVRAMTRNPEAAELPHEVEVVRGDLTIPATLDDAARGTDAVFLVWVAPDNAVDAAIERLARSTRRIVFLSTPHQTPHPFFQQTNPMARMHAHIEHAIQSSGVDWTFLRPGMFASNCIAWWAAQIRERGIVRWPYLDAPTAPIDERDVAAVAVRALTGNDHSGKEYTITGPESLTQREQIEIIGDVIGKRIRAEELSPDEARRELPFPPAALDMLLKAWRAAVGLPAYVTTTVREVTGRPARTFREWAADHARKL